MTENRNDPERKEEKKIIWLVTCSGANDGPINPKLSRKLPALKSVLSKIAAGSRIICGPDEQQRQTAESLGFYPNIFLPECNDFAMASLLIREELTRQADGAIIFASPKLLRIIGAVRIIDGQELPGCYGFRTPVKNYSLYKIFINRESGQIGFIGRRRHKKPPWSELKPP